MLGLNSFSESGVRILVGLGNPGEEYVGTRHNLGFEVLDLVAERLGASWRRLSRKDGFSGRVKGRVAEVTPAMLGEESRGDGILLLKPMTYMNLSGVAVAALARRLELAPESIFVVYDDLNLPLGRIRLRPGGSPGGHNGIKSLVACLGSEGFPRLRIGIGRSDLDSGRMADPDFVLGRFEESERELLAPVLQASVDCCLAWMKGESLPELMTRFNGFSL
ncbi:MAG TPA: aminoacyl-tRNA hydrolase [Planctomycetes bacterium]|nr:aminoacyl-tRNA hydrolase [Planctomycetota bacterium]